MKQEIPKPLIIIAIIAAVALAVIVGKSALSGAPQPSAEEKAKFTPSWIDPATNKPRANGPPQTGGSSPGGPPAGFPMSGRPMSSGQPTSNGQPIGSPGGR